MSAVARDAVDVGVDGGQSRTRLRVVPDGSIRCADGVSRLEGDPEAAIVVAVLDAWRSGSTAPVNRLVLGLTTAPHTTAGRRDLASTLGAAMNAREVWLAEDLVTAHAGALPDRHGVALTVGTGVACMAVDAATGRSHVVDGAGYLLGDDGGGFWIGRAGIATVLRALDGRGPATAMHELAARHFGTLDGLATALHSLDRPVARIAGFAPEVLAAAAAGDPPADQIVDRAAGELARTVSAAAEHLGTDPVPVALGGRVLADDSPLRDLLIHQVRHDNPRVVPILADGTPLDGACALAQSSSPDPYRSMIHIQPEDCA